MRKTIVKHLTATVDYRSLLLVPICVAILSACATHHSSPSQGESLTCEEHAQVSVYLNNWAAKNFDETYGKKMDAKSANVQLFLIQQKAPSPYAASFNRYQEKAMENIALARKKGCDVSAYPSPPIDEFKKRLSLIWPHGAEQWWNRQ